MDSEDLLLGISQEALRKNNISRVSKNIIVKNVLRNLKTSSKRRMASRSSLIGKFLKLAIHEN